MIDSRAIVDRDARLASDVTVGPWTLVGPGVEIGAGTVIGPHVVIKGLTKIGANNRIFQFCSIGEDCQDLKYQQEPTWLEIGDHNIFRESCTIHRGTVQDRGVTTIGHHNLFMVNVHVAHDCVIGNHCILANDANLAGHVRISDWAVLGGATQVHQFCRIGAHSLCAVGAVLLKDLPAYVIASGNVAKPHGINQEGLKRRGFEPETIAIMRKAYKILYRQGLTLKEALVRLNLLAEDSVSVNLLIESLIHASGRGIVR